MYISKLPFFTRIMHFSLVCPRFTLDTRVKCATNNVKDLPLDFQTNLKANFNNGTLFLTPKLILCVRVCVCERMLNPLAPDKSNKIEWILLVYLHVTWICYLYVCLCCGKWKKIFFIKAKCGMN